MKYFPSPRFFSMPNMMNIAKALAAKALAKNNTGSELVKLLEVMAQRLAGTGLFVQMGYRYLAGCGQAAEEGGSY